jgi:hypothetical protein
MIHECQRCRSPLFDTMSHCATCGLENPVFAGPFASGIPGIESLIRFSPLLVGALVLIALFLEDALGLPDDTYIALWLALTAGGAVLVGAVVRALRRRRARQAQAKWQIPNP